MTVTAATKESHGRGILIQSCEKYLQILTNRCIVEHEFLTGFIGADRVSVRRHPRKILIGNLVYFVREKAGIFRAATNNILGWTSIWADDVEELVTRIKLAMRGGQ